ncbi:hypothetical protein NQ318_012692 [Aromia moschata]|uniref:RNase H type-1 domain-containing protein n=1 Tax=Aromia moschata TaxID=1265417 RepID=A0AAV8YJI5_9CUCU|nr:hypothetical protein NQ318_012692 [Aromia moschata]
MCVNTCRVLNHHQPGELSNSISGRNNQNICLIRRSFTNKRIQIISDSQAALKALGAVEIHSEAVKDCMDSLTQLAEHNSITLKWMRGHQGHEGNERGDFIAKKGTEVPLIGPEPTSLGKIAKIDTALNAVVCRAGIRALGQFELGAHAPRGRIAPNYTVCVKPTDKKQPQTHRRRKLRAPPFPPIGDYNYKVFKYAIK